MPRAGFIVLGLVQGSIAGLNSLGLVLLWRTTRLVNLAQPAMGLVGGVQTGLLVVVSHWSFWWAAPVGILTGAILGFTTDRVVLRRMREAPRAVLLVATVGLAGVFAGIQTALPFAFTGRSLPTYQINFGVTFSVFPLRFGGADVLALIAFPLTLLGCLWFLYRTRFGLAALALGQDAERARALGVSAAVVRSVVWAVVGVVASISGILSIPVFGFDLGGSLSGAVVLLLALTPAVLAGFRSLIGTAVAALCLGVAYQIVGSYSNRPGIADMVFAGGILIAVAVQGRRIGRTETATRASSWEAAVTTRPLSWRVTSLMRYRVSAGTFTVAIALVAMVPPLFLAGYNDLLYATKTATALAALSVGFAWMFAGEVALGQWGIAGLGGAVSTFVPGPLVGRVVVAAISMAVLEGGMAFASRRRSSLSFAVLGLAAAGAAPFVVSNLARKPITSDPAVLGMIGGVLVVLVAAWMTKFRSTRTGGRMIAARDDPQRAPWLGADPLRMRVLALAIAGAMAGAAGALYLATFQIDVPPEVFGALTSLDLLTMAVLGGLGSPSGVVAGAVAVMAGRALLPGPWGLLLSGAGMLLVLIFRPSGLSGALEWMRNQALRVIVGAARSDPVRPAEPAGTAAA